MGIGDREPDGATSPRLTLGGLTRSLARVGLIADREKQAGTSPGPRTVTVLGRGVSLTDAGEGPPILFVHGGVAASYIWRRVLPVMAEHGRCVAFDPLGTGDSERLPSPGENDYGVRDHTTYLSAILSALSISERVTLVVLGWASIPALDWASRHPDRIRAIAHMESIVTPLAWPNIPESLRSPLRRARSEEGSDYVLATERYFEEALSSDTLTPLREPDRVEYRRLWGDTQSSRRAHYSGLRMIPISGSPADTRAAVIRYRRWLERSPVPKLLIAGEPGSLLVGPQLSTAEQFPNQTMVRVRGTHLLPEDSPDGVGTFLSAWFRKQVLANDYL